MPTTVISFRIDNDVYSRLKILAEKNGKTTNDYSRYLLLENLSEKLNSDSSSIKKNKINSEAEKIFDELLLTFERLEEKVEKIGREIKEFKEKLNSDSSSIKKTKINSEAEKNFDKLLLAFERMEEKEEKIGQEIKEFKEKFDEQNVSDSKTKTEEFKPTFDVNALAEQIASKVIIPSTPKIELESSWDNLNTNLNALKKRCDNSFWTLCSILVITVVCLGLGVVTFFDTGKVIDGIYTEDNSSSGGDPRHSAIKWSKSFEENQKRKEKEADKTEKNLLRIGR